MSKTKVLKLLKDKSVRFVTPRMIEERTNLSRTNAKSILAKLEKDDFLVRVKRGLYANGFLDDLHPYEAVPYLTEKEAYVSLYSVLSDEGIIEDLPTSIYVVTNATGRNYDTPLGRYRLYRMADRHIWGYKKEQFKHSIRPIAEPEKAFLDLVYLSSTPSRDISLPGNWREIADQLNQDRLHEYAVRFGSRVENFISNYQSTEYEGTAKS